MTDKVNGRRGATNGAGRLYMGRIFGESASDRGAASRTLRELVTHRKLVGLRVDETDTIPACPRLSGFPSISWAAWAVVS